MPNTVLSGTAMPAASSDSRTADKASGSMIAAKRLAEARPPALP